MTNLTDFDCSESTLKTVTDLRFEPYPCAIFNFRPLSSLVYRASQFLTDVYIHDFFLVEKYDEVVNVGDPLEFSKTAKGNVPYCRFTIPNIISGNEDNIGKSNY